MSTIIPNIYNDVDDDDLTLACNEMYEEHLRQVAPAFADADPGGAEEPAALRTAAACCSRACASALRAKVAGHGTVTKPCGWCGQLNTRPRSQSAGEFHHCNREHYLAWRHRRELQRMPPPRRRG